MTAKREIPTYARNFALNVYVNGKKVEDIYLNGTKLIKEDKIGGQGAAQFSFSLDNKYFAFRSRSGMGCAGSCHNFDIYVVDLGKKTIDYIKSPRKIQDYSGYNQNPTQPLTPFMESYAWDNNGLKIIFYFVGYSDRDQYYRVSPRGLWRYDLTAKQYTLLETLPE